MNWVFVSHSFMTCPSRLHEGPPAGPRRLREEEHRRTLPPVEARVRDETALSELVPRELDPGAVDEDLPRPAPLEEEPRGLDGRRVLVQEPLPVPVPSGVARGPPRGGHDPRGPAPPA